MKSLVAAGVLLPGAALAHDAPVPHDHGLFAAAGLIVVAIAAAMGATVVLRRVFRGMS